MDEKPRRVSPDFLKIADEIDLKMDMKEILTYGGIESLLQAVGEIGTAYRIGLDLVIEHYEGKLKGMGK